MQHLSEKTQFPGLLFPQIVQKHYTVNHKNAIF